QAAALPQLAQRAASGAAGVLTLSFVSTADYSVLPALLREFREAWPQVQIELREATSDVQLEDLAQQRIDAGLLIPPLPERVRAELDYLPILQEPLLLAAPKSMRLRAHEPVALRALADAPLIIFPRRIAPALHDMILACFHAAGLAPRIGQEAIQMQTIVGLVAAGMGIALVPQSVSNLRRAGVAYHALAEPAPLVETGLAWRRDNRQPVLAAFLQLLRKKR
ncbi:MAG: LysR substrate-binding domain-containing protein, partial [Burkholderiaceae bacterium]